MPLHTSTYRLQLHAGFTLRDAAHVVPYLGALGVGAVYLSPITTAVPGSRHGYDVCNPEEINPELGGGEAMEHLGRVLKAWGMGCILDIVPNHMAADPAHNPWWRDVLQHGSASRYADFFDIDWRPRKEGLHGKILLPVLGDAYGKVLTRGELRLEARDGHTLLRYHDVTFPLHPDTLTTLDPGGDASPEDVVTRLNGTPGDAHSHDALHDLLERQSYRLANWKTARHEANYRRFFDVSSLLGVRMERPEVFAKTHRLLRTLIDRNLVTGVRVDHVDGLRDPHAYLTALRDLLSGETGTNPTYLIVEKILEDEESPPSEWPIDGTSGYDFLGELELLFVPEEGLREMRRIFREIVGSASQEQCPPSSADLIHSGKRSALKLLFGSEVNALADLLDRLSEMHRDYRDFTRDDLRHALGEVIACLPVYRTYGRVGALSQEDEEMFRDTLQEAARRNPSLTPELFDFIGKVFLSFQPAHDPAPLPRSGCHAFSQRLQQLMGAVHAKGVEDTAFYRDTGMLALNEVGLSPERSPLDVASFHRKMQRRLEQAPHGMITTSTHDTKRGEDVRARIAVLAEAAETWTRAVTALQDAAGRAWAREDHMLYQTLVGCWPISAETGLPAPVDDVFLERMQSTMLKSVREAKLKTSWIHPDEEYERDVFARVSHLLRGSGFPLVERHLFPLIVTCAERGMRASLARLACKFAVPGIPDVYQGTESWDLSLVDPDNRRPADFEKAVARLQELAPLLEDYSPTAPSAGTFAFPMEDSALTRSVSENVTTEAEHPRRAHLLRLLEHWPDGDIKRFLTARCLRWRKDHPHVFMEGTYAPLPCGPRTPSPDADETFHHPGYAAFMRRSGSEALLVFFPVRPLPALPPEAPDGSIPFDDMVVRLPRDWEGTPLQHVFTGTRFVPRGAGRHAELEISALLRDFPVAWLWRETRPDS